MLETGTLNSLTKWVHLFPNLITLLSTPRLASCNVTSELVEHVAFGLTFPWSPLRDLDLSNNDLKDSGVKLLCAGLTSQYCKLKTLRYTFIQQTAHTQIS